VFCGIYLGGCNTKVPHNTDAMVEGAPETHVLDEAVLATEFYAASRLVTLTTPFSVLPMFASHCLPT
jgi:hypothetical protein